MKILRDVRWTSAHLLKDRGHAQWVEAPPGHEELILSHSDRPKEHARSVHGGRADLCRIQVSPSC